MSIVNPTSLVITLHVKSLNIQLKGKYWQNKLKRKKDPTIHSLYKAHFRLNNTEKLTQIGWNLNSNPIIQIY